MTGKKKLSGYQNRKRALLKDKKELIALKKCRKIQDMFLEKTSTVEGNYTIYINTYYLHYII